MIRCTEEFDNTIKEEDTIATSNIGAKNNQREKLLKRVVGGYEKIRNGNSRVRVRRQPQPRESKS